VPIWPVLSFADLEILYSEIVHVKLLLRHTLVPVEAG